MQPVFFVPIGIANGRDEETGFWISMV